MTGSRYRNGNRIITRFQKTHFNLGTIVFFILFVYIVINTINYLQKDHISIYEVTEKKMSDDNSMTGFAIRTEDIYQADNSGSIAYYTSKGHKTGAKSPLFSVDVSGAYSDYLSSVKVTETQDIREVENIRNIISSYRNNYNGMDYTDVNNLKYSIESAMLSSVTESMIKEFQTNTPQNTTSFSVVNSKESGIVSYWFDGYEDVTKEKINASYFDVSDTYCKTNLKTSDKIEKGANVCKVTTSEHWNIIVKLTEVQYKKMEDKTYVGIRFSEDGLETNVSFELFTKDGDYFASLGLDDFISRYIDERYIDLELYLDRVDGLKIPKSALIEKNCYMIPVRYLTKNPENNKDVLCFYRDKKDGNDQKIGQLDAICMQDEEYVYIDCDAVTPGTVFISPNSTDPNNPDNYTVGEMKTFVGVYNVNKGYCQFKNTEIIYDSPEYCIVKKDTKYGLAIYDHIVINPELINENDIIY